MTPLIRHILPLLLLLGAPGASFATEFCEFESPPVGAPQLPPIGNGTECHQFYDLGDYPPNPFAPANSLPLVREHLFSGNEAPIVSVNICGLGDALRAHASFVTFAEVDFDTVVNTTGVYPSAPHRLALTAAALDPISNMISVIANWYRVSEAPQSLPPGKTSVAETVLIQPATIVGAFNGDSCFGYGSKIDIHVSAMWSVHVAVGLESGGQWHRFAPDPAAGDGAELRPTTLRAGALVSEFAAPRVFALQWDGIQATQALQTLEF